MADIRRL
ncbi:ATP-NAD kinase family protein, partial [Vibrio harveyi]